MSEIVKCEICGKLFNRRYVKSHKRLAHDKKLNPVSRKLSEPEVVHQRQQGDNRAAFCHPKSCARERSSRCSKTGISPTLHLLRQTL